ncbi:MAG TPA: hypothetical protein PLW10_14085, partial [Myxococcota bacterium]|nr:hypothetical protein [Myxococcota bacterium]
MIDRSVSSSPSLTWRRGARRLTASGLIAVMTGVVAGASTAMAAEPDEPRPTMRAVFEEMKVLIPLSLDEGRWSDPANQTRILQALDRLERQADALERHGRAREVGFDALAINLADDLRQVHGYYRQGAFDEARFFLTGSLQNCVSCHVRLPSSQSFPLADELLSQVEIQALDPREQAWLNVTVRRFDAALAAWEALMADPEVAPAQLDASGVLVDYLNVVLRVRTDIPRAKRTLERLSRRQDVPVYLESRLESWRTALSQIDPARYGGERPPSLERGVELAETASIVNEGPFGRDGLIQDLVAASQLVRWLEADQVRQLEANRNPTDAERLDRARAYYWLGVVESRSLDGFWVNLSERHLEAAVRADPKGPLARRAYNR